MVIFIIAGFSFTHTVPTCAADDNEDKTAKAVKTAEEPQIEKSEDKTAKAVKTVEEPEVVESEDRIAKAVKTVEEPEVEKGEDKTAKAEKSPVIPAVENPPAGEKGRFDPEVIVPSKATLEGKIIVNNDIEAEKPPVTPVVENLPADEKDRVAPKEVLDSTTNPAGKIVVDDAAAENPPVTPAVENPPADETKQVDPKEVVDSTTLAGKRVINDGEDEEPEVAPIQPLESKPAGNQRLVLRNCLYNSYPNPCNPEAWIPYSLRDVADVRIDIYNAKGLLVRTLPLGHQSPGVYISPRKAAFWDGRDNNGLELASGVYFYSLRAGKFLAVKRLLLLK